MKLRFLGHAAFELSDGRTNLLIDPYISGNPLATVKASELKPDYILVTHFHGDHLGDTVEIAKRTGATVITTAEGAGILQKQGVKVHPMALGGKAKFPFGLIRVTLAFHGFGDVGGHACGFVIHMGGRRVYHAGDTALFSDMKLLNGVIEEPGIDVALLPIGDNYTMGPEDAAVAVQWIQPKVAIPMHFNTFPLIQVDPATFTSRVAKAGESKTVVLQPGQTYEF
ncbi:MAG: metal-dependent hydrolase [Mycobacterium leprae]